MLKLKNVSKFYYNKGIVTSGFNKISLNFNLGEFVAITGESGSGKSTLLNVLSGLDSYEEGEMYINGEETSHYTEIDYEIYRRKYISNIFQNFNLINSYTVYQNIELVLLLNGFKKRDIKEKILNIIKDVGLYKYRNRRVSKLSGGQKQRVAIARALAKDTPIILADEPTGNLDFASSDSVLKLLSEIAKDKLVIIVTHNYNQIEKYVTRKITMHDGKVLEDKRIKEVKEVKESINNIYKDMTIINKLRIGIRNTFNVVPKFLLIFVVYLFIIFALTSSYSSFKKSEYELSSQGYSSFFNELSDKRIVINKKDRTNITENDYEELQKTYGIDYVIKNDLTLDTSISISSDYYSFYGKVNNANQIDFEIAYGRKPESDNEVLILGSSNDYFLTEYIDDILDKTFYISDLSNWTTDEKYNVKVVGIAYSDNFSAFDNAYFYVNDSIIDDLVDNLNKQNSTVKYTFNDTEYDSHFNSINSEILPNNNVPRGGYIISEDLRSECSKLKCNNYKLNILVKSVYYEDRIELSYNNYYKKSNFNKLLGIQYDKYNGAIFINTEDYNNLFNKGYFQSSVFIKNVDDKDITMSVLNKMGYNTLYIKDTLTNYYEEELAIVKIIEVILLATLLIALFFISYFIIKIILKSRNVYFATVRILGGSIKSIKQLLDIELFTISLLSYMVFFIFLYLLNNDVINIIYLKEMYNYLNVFDYVVFILITFIMSRLITNRFTRKLFSSSAMNTYKEEV